MPKFGENNYLNNEKTAIDWPSKDSENPPKKFELHLVQMEDSKKRIICKTIQKVKVLSKIKKLGKRLKNTLW